MKKENKTFMLTSVLLMFALLGFGIAYNRGFDFKGLDLLIFALIVIVGGIAVFLSHKRDKSIEAGFPAEDEMSLLLKYKAGYYAFLSSMYIWLFIFIFKDKFPDVESMLGGGILLSALNSFFIKFIIKRGLNG